MIKRLSQAGVPVLDQDSAKAFYTEKLGFEVRTDQTMDGFRWLTVSPPDQQDFEFILWYPGPPMYDEETAQQIRALVAKGATLELVKAARPTADYDTRYGSTTGPWTTDMFVEAVYRDLSRRK